MKRGYLFTTTTCSRCPVIKERLKSKLDLQELDGKADLKVPNNVLVLNAHLNSELVKRFEISSVPTLVLLDDDNINYEKLSYDKILEVF
jgi:hypothetical protein